MGEAKRRGSFDERRRTAIKSNKKLLLQHLGGVDERGNSLLTAGLQLFLSRMTEDAWKQRRTAVLEFLKSHPEVEDLAEASPVRVREDEIGWYLFLCDQAVNDPMCTDISQAQRILPFFAGIGARWEAAVKVKGLHRKVDEALGKYKKDPDGILFEILVALSYAAHGWEVEMLEETSAKTPDMVVRNSARELYIECKRLSRRTEYAEKERNTFLRMWDQAGQVLVQNRQWVWFQAVFHAEVQDLSTDLLEEAFRQALPLRGKEALILDNEQATIRARLIDQSAVRDHFNQYRVKANSPMLTRVLGGDWAPENAEVTLLQLVRTSQVAGCELSILGTYVDKVEFACGITREFDSDASIEKKAKEITKYLAEAVRQVPGDRPSIIHIAAEALEGGAVERRRTEKVMSRIPTFVSDKPVLAVRFHRLQSHQRVEKQYEMDETVDTFAVDNIDLQGIPGAVVAPPDTPMRSGAHWDLYPD